MKRRCMSVVVIALSFLFATHVLGGDAEMMEKSDFGKSSGIFSSSRAGDIIGKTVTNRSDVELGTVQDLVFDDEGRVSYLILSRGGLFTMGGRLIPVPVNTTDLTLSEDRLVVDISKERLDQAPHFAKGEWPDFSDSGWQEMVHGYYGGEPGSEPSGMGSETETSVEDE